MMRLNDFSMRVRARGAHEQSSGHVLLDHGQDYKVVLRNDNQVPADVELKVDGKSVGLWRVNAKSSIELERPADEARKFTFFLSGTEESDAANLDGVGTDDLGLLQAVFKPGKAKPKELRKRSIVRTVGLDQFRTPPYGTGDFPYQTWCTNSASTKGGLDGSLSAGPINAQAGGTGLGESSDQRFCEVGFLPEYDEERITTISLRLVGRDRVQAVNELKPTVTANPVPAPVYRS